MRDLSGRRQRDVNNERRLKDYISGQVRTFILNKKHVSFSIGIAWVFDIFYMLEVNKKIVNKKIIRKKL